jgi:hypothetical protein
MPAGQSRRARRLDLCSPDQILASMECAACGAQGDGPCSAGSRRVAVAAEMTVCNLTSLRTVACAAGLKSLSFWPPDKGRLASELRTVAHTEDLEAR